MTVTTQLERWKHCQLSCTTRSSPFTSTLPWSRAWHLPTTICWRAWAFVWCLHASVCSHVLGKPESVSHALCGAWFVAWCVVWSSPALPQYANAMLTQNVRTLRDLRGKKDSLASVGIKVCGTVCGCVDGCGCGCGTVCVCTHLHLTVAHCACVHHAMRCTPFTAGQVLFSPSVLSPG